jgi:hypothetical protein
MYSLIALFGIIPLIFSHFFAGLGEGFIIDNGIGHFESVKMPIFLVLILLATFEMSLRKTFSTKKTLIVGTSLVIFGFIGYTIFPHENIRDLLFGI